MAHLAVSKANGLASVVLIFGVVLYMVGELDPKPWKVWASEKEASTS